MINVTFNLTYIQFNSIEAFFWITFGLIVLVVGKKFQEFQNMSKFTSVNLVIFGTSDVLEVFFGSFLFPEESGFFF